jgi:hypothetical protein
LITYVRIFFYSAILVLSTLAIGVKDVGAASDENYFITAVNTITDWFQHLSAAFDKIAQAEERRQLTRKVEKLSNSLYELETTREAFIKSLLALRPNLRDQEKIYFFNQKTQDFRDQMEIVEKLLRDIGATLRQQGVEGRQVEEIIRFGFNYNQGIAGKAVRERASYGFISVEHFNEEEVLDESKRCMQALKAAQLASSEFLEHLKKKD